MKPCKIVIIVILTLSTQIILGQKYPYSPNVPGAQIEYFSGNYFLHTSSSPVKTNVYYTDVVGSPYLKSDFVDGILYLTDTTAVKLPLRYNIYTDEMEYRIDSVNYVIGSPQVLSKILLGESVFVYLTFIPGGGYFELLESGKSFLVQKRSVKYQDAEGPKPIVGYGTPATFTSGPDVFYIVINNAQPIEIENMKSVITAFQDQKEKIESYIRQEKIKKVNKENLIKIVKYYNSL